MLQFLGCGLFALFFVTDMQEVFQQYASVRQQQDIKHRSSEAFSDVSLPCYDHLLFSLLELFDSLVSLFSSISLSSCLLPVLAIETCDSSEWEARAI